MSMTLSGSGVITGLVAGGLPDATVTTSEIVDASITPAKLSGAQTGSAPIYGVRAWITFSAAGGTITTLASGNASVTRNGVGDYSITFTTAMPNANYSVSGSAQWVGASGLPSVYPFVNGSGGLVSPTTSGFRFVVAGSGALAQVQDSAIVNILVIA